MQKKGEFMDWSISHETINNLFPPKEIKESVCLCEENWNVFTKKKMILLEKRNLKSYETIPLAKLQ